MEHIFVAYLLIYLFGDERCTAGSTPPMDLLDVMLLQQLASCEYYVAYTTVILLALLR